MARTIIHEEEEEEAAEEEDQEDERSAAAQPQDDELHTFRHVIHPDELAEFESTQHSLGCANCLLQDSSNNYPCPFDAPVLFCAIWSISYYVFENVF